MELTESLRNLGFTRQEATIFITLCKHGELTGYEAAKLSGISRSNAYAALSSLVDKGYANLIGGNPVKYVPISKEELILNSKRQFNETVNIIENKLSYNETEHEPYVTIINEKNIVNKIKNMLLEAKQRLYFSADESILRIFYDELQHAIDNGLKVVILSNQMLELPEHIYYKSKSQNSLKLIVDTTYVMTGTLEQCLYSKNKTLVQLMKEAIVNEIDLIKIKSDEQK